MSINTENLITTRNGQAELAEIHSVNKKLFADRREISVEMLFPFMAISEKTSDEIEEITDISVQEIKQEACWANVDVCQVHSYNVEEVLKRDFAIGGLFDVKEDIPHALTVVLFARTRIVDSRSSGRKARDGNRSAEDIVESEYGYVGKYVPFAYTRLLDSNGVYSESGIKIGASLYGRARHRFYFNYIIDNNDGIADDITVDDRVYPYSDGYLSKTAFELGLKRYEDAIKGFSADYEKYAKGRNRVYYNVEDALTHSVAGNKFYLEKRESDGVTFQTYNLKNNSTFGFENWPTINVVTGPESYKRLSAINLDPVNFDSSISRKPWQVDRYRLFSYTDVRKVEFEGLDGVVSTKFLPVKLDCMMFIRTGLPYCRENRNDTTYNFMRFTIQIVDGARTIVEGYEVYAASEFRVTINDHLVFKPKIPSIGKIHIKETLTEYNESVLNVKFLLMTEELRTYYGYYDQGTGYKLFSNVTFREVDFSNIFQNGTGVGSEYGTKKINVYRRIEPNTQIGDDENYDLAWRVDTTEKEIVDVDGALYDLIPITNSPVGYAFSYWNESLTSTDYTYKLLLPKEFEKSHLEHYRNLSYLDSDYISKLITINDMTISDSVKLIEGGSLKELGSIDISNRLSQYFENHQYLHDSSSGDDYRIVCDNYLNNARIIVGEEISSRSGDYDYRSISGLTEVYILLMLGNKAYKLVTDYSHLMNSTADIQSIDCTGISVCHDIRMGNSSDSDHYDHTQITLKWIVYKKDQTSEVTTVLKYYNGSWLETFDGVDNFVLQNYVAVEDISGEINLMTETSM